MSALWQANTTEGDGLKEDRLRRKKVNEQGKEESKRGKLRCQRAPPSSCCHPDAHHTVRTWVSESTCS